MEIKLTEEPILKIKNRDSAVKISDLKKTPKVLSKSVSLKNLMPKTGYFEKNIFKNAKEADRLSDEIVVEDLSFYQELWKRIDAKFYYPDVFNALLMYGGAYVEIYVNPNGSLSRYILKVDSSNEHIETLVKGIVVDALSEPLNKALWHPGNKEIKLDLNFELNMVKVPEALDNYSKGRVNRREMFFYRKVFNPKAHIIAKTLPFLGGGGMIDVVYLFNAASGRLKRIHERNIKKLKKLKIENESLYSRKRN